MTQIKTRILIAIEDTRDILYNTTDITVLKKIAPDHDSYHKDVGPLEVGTKFQFTDQDFEVKKITSHYYDVEHPNDSNVGLQDERQREAHPFNFQITYWVDEVDK